MLRSPFADILRWGTEDPEGAIDTSVADNVGRWIDEGGFFYAGARSAGASDEVARNLNPGPGLLGKIPDDIALDLGTLGMLAFRDVSGGLDG